jgi:type I restriction enzyme S subunit
MKVKLGDVCEVYSGYALKSFNDDEEGLPVVKIGNIHTDGTLNLDECQYTTDNVNEKYYSNEGDIYIALSGATTGKIGIMHSGDKYIINQRVGIVRKKNGNIPQDYIKYFLLRQSDRILQEAAGCAQPNISPKQIAEYLVPNISENEMMNISYILDKVKGVIDSRKQELEQLDILIKARFVEMFGDENNSMNWNIVNVENVADVQVGVVIKPSQYYTEKTNGIPAFRSLNIGEGYIKNTDWVYFTKEGHEKNSKSILKENDLLIVRSGAPGTACVVTKEYIGYNAIDVIIAHPDCSIINPFYLCAYTNMPHGKNQILEGTGGAAQQHFNVGKYNKLKLMLPPIEKQNKFIDFVAQVDKSKVIDTNIIP